MEVAQKYGVGKGVGSVSQESKQHSPERSTYCTQRASGAEGAHSQAALALAENRPLK